MKKHFRGLGLATVLLTSALIAGAALTAPVAHAAVPAADGNDCGESTGTFVRGCARIGTFNLGHAYYWPGLRLDKKTGKFYRLEKSGGEYEFNNVGAELWDKCETQFGASGRDNCIRKGAWSMRKADVRKAIQNAGLDIVVLQELEDEEVWSTWATNGSQTLKKHRDEVRSMLSSLGFSRVSTAQASATGTEIFYRTSRFVLYGSAVDVTEKSLMGGKEPEAFRDAPANPGMGFTLARFQRIGTGTENARNTVLLAAGHFPTDTFFESSKSVTFGGEVYTGAKLKGTAYRRWLAKYLVREAGKLACRNVCTGVDYEKPAIPMVFLGDVNSTYQSEGNEVNGTLVTTRTAPYSLINETNYGFVGPSYAISPSLEQRRLDATGISREQPMDLGRVIDHALLKVPTALNLTGHSVKAKGLGVDGGTTLEDYRASDHRLVKLTFLTEYP